MVYYKENGKFTQDVSFNLKDDDGTVEERFSSAACFNLLKYKPWSNIGNIEVFQLAAMVAYEEKEVRRWIDELNVIGFPITLSLSENNRRNTNVNKLYKNMYMALLNHDYATTYYFFLKKTDYKNISFLMSALTLIRLLWEPDLYHIVNSYFNIIDESPQADKLEALQRVNLCSPRSVHSITNRNAPTNNINMEQFIERKNLSQNIVSQIHDYIFSFWDATHNYGK